MLTYLVRVADSLGIFTRRGYKTFKEAEDACRFYGLNAESKTEPKLLSARVIDSNGRVRYDYISDQYDWEDPSLNEEVA